MNKPKFYRVTDVFSIPITDRDVNGVYYLRTPDGFEAYTVANTPSRDFIPQAKRRANVLSVNHSMGFVVGQDVDYVVVGVSGGVMGIGSPSDNEGRVINILCTFTSGLLKLDPAPLIGGSIRTRDMGGRTSQSLDSPRWMSIVSNGSDWLIANRGL